MEIYKKIRDAIDEIKNSKLKKLGYNDYSKYYYYTPEQVSKLVYDACKKFNLFVKFDLLRTEFGILGEMIIIDIDNIENDLCYKMSTDIPQIKATNITQQLGGAMTYTKRYMLMNVFDIVDNTLDFDTPQKQPKKTTTTTTENRTNIHTWLSEDQFNQTLDSNLNSINRILKDYNGQNGKGMKKDFRLQLEKIVIDAKVDESFNNSNIDYRHEK